MALRIFAQLQPLSYTNVFLLAVAEVALICSDVYVHMTKHVDGRSSRKPLPRSRDHMLSIRPLFGGVLINFFRIHQVILHTKQQHKSAPQKQVMNLQLRLTSNYTVCRFLHSPWHLSSHPPRPTNFVVST